MTSKTMDDDDAAHWAIRLDNAPLSPAEQQAFDAWLGEDTRREGALLRAEATLAYLDRGRALAEPFPEAQSPPQMERVGEMEGYADAEGHNDNLVLTRRGFLIGGGALAGLVAASVSGFIVMRSAPLEIKTTLGEIRRVPLPDGSVASVNTASEVAVVMADNRRDVRLGEGEAWFQVAHDTQRPFIVEAGKVRVRAVGTAFSVRRYEGGADVLVTEGVVETWVEGHEGQRTLIRAGSSGFVAENARPVDVTFASDTMDRTLSWRTGELVLNGESLDHAAAELNRYNLRKIVIDSPDLGRKTLVGYFRVDQPENFSRAVTETMGARMRMEGETIHLSR